MPTEYTSVRLPIPEAEVLADQYAVIADLERVLHICKSAEQMADLPQHDSDVVEALVCAAVVRYFRCFSASPRLGLRHDEIGRSDEDIRQRHDWFHKLRDKFVAHCLNPCEQVWVSAALSVKDGVPQPIQSLTQGGKRMLLGNVEAQSLARLAQHALDLIKGKTATEYEKVLEVVQSMPLEKLMLLRRREHPRIRAKDVGRDRRQTRPKPPNKRASPEAL